MSQQAHKHINSLWMTYKPASTQTNKSKHKQTPKQTHTFIHHSIHDVEFHSKSHVRILDTKASSQEFM